MTETSHEDRCRGHYQLPGLEIQVGETQVIMPSRESDCPCACLFKLIDGEIVLAAYSNGSFPSVRSRDEGHTWREAPDWRTWCAYQFPDGELIQVHPAFLRETEQPGVYATSLERSMDNGYTYQSERVLVTGLPELAPEIDRPGRPRYIDHSIVALRDGSLLAGAMAKFAGDTKTRSIVVRSTDRGRTWQYVSTVAFDLTEGDERRRSGFEEPCLQMLPNGEVLCFMRSGGAVAGWYWPLYMSRSSDDGNTWSHADPIADRGVMPNSCLMSNGVLALIYGRPGDWLAFSIDCGHTWVGHFCLRQGPQAIDCSHYDSIIEVAPDTLLAAYGRTDPNNCRMAEILGTFVTVRRV
jgi:hypothetical protein